MKLLVALAVLVMLGAVVDVVAEQTAETRIRDRLQGSVESAGDASVEVQGRPFLLQAARGRFDGLDLELTSIERNGLEIDRLVLSLKGVDFSREDLIEGSGEIRVDAGDGAAFVSEDSLGRLLDREPSIPDDVTINLRERGARLKAVWEADVARFALESDRRALAVTSPALGGALRLPLPRLAEGVDYEGVEVRNQLLVLTLDVSATSLDPGSL